MKKKVKYALHVNKGLFSLESFFLDLVVLSYDRHLSMSYSQVGTMYLLDSITKQVLYLLDSIT